MRNPHTVSLMARHRYVLGSVTASTDKALSSARLIKLLRMLKLTRVMKASSRLKPYVLELLMGRLESTYSALKVAELILWLVWFTHLQACLWGLSASLLTTETTWITSFRDGHRASFDEEPAAWELYSAALYWSAMTITSIGYANSHPPQIPTSAHPVASSFLGRTGTA